MFVNLFDTIVFATWFICVQKKYTVHGVLILK